MGGRRLPFSIQYPSLRNPPVPVYAMFNGINGEITVVFDNPLKLGVKDQSKWFGRWGNVERVNQVVPTASGQNIVWDTTAGGADVGANVVIYSGGDPDMTGYWGAPILPFQMTLNPV